MISWLGVTVAYDAATRLGPVTIEVGEQEWVGLIGPNGAGKSTMLKAAVGLVDHSGEVRLGGSKPRPGLDAAWMPQRPRLPEEMGVSDYVLLGRTPHVGYVGTETRADQRAAAAAMDRLALGDLAGRTLSTLSGGETQRVLLARALAQEAPILLLDEPTASLDIGHAVDVLEVIDDLRLARGLTVVTAVHDLTLAGRFADRLVLMSNGAVVAEGKPGEVLTEEHLAIHYEASVRVELDGQGPAVIPVRRNHV